MRNFVAILAVFTGLVLSSTTNASAKENKLSEVTNYFVEVCNVDENGIRSQCEFKPVFDFRMPAEREWNRDQTVETVMDEVLAQAKERSDALNNLKQLLDRMNNPVPTSARVASL